MKVKLLAGAAMAAVFAASGAYAQDTGWYGAIDLGAHYMEGLDGAFPADIFDTIPRGQLSGRIEKDVFAVL